MELDDNSDDGNDNNDDIGSKEKGASPACRAIRAESVNGMTTLPIDRPMHAMGLTVEGPSWVRTDDTGPDALGAGEAAAAAAAARRRGGEMMANGASTQRSNGPGRLAHREFVAGFGAGEP